MSKNCFGKFWNFYPWRPQFWPEPKNDRNDFEMIFRELSNAAFRFSLRRPGAEIMGGGGVQTPPPPAGGGKSRDPAGRGLIRCHHPINYVFDRPVADLWILFGRGKKFALQTVTWGDRVTSRIRQSSVRRFSPLPSDLQISERRRLRYTSHFTFPSPHCRTKSDSLSMYIVQLHSYSQETEHQMCKSMAWQKNKTQSMQLVEMLSSTQIMLRTVIFLGGAKWYVCLPIFRLGGATAHFAYT